MAYGKKRMTRKRPMYRKKKGGLVKRAVRKARKQVFAKRVKSVVNRMAETKCANWSTDENPGDNNYPLGLPIVCSASASHDSYFKELVPGDGTTTHSTITIGQGDGQGNRSGNEISTVKCTLSGVLRFNTTFNTLTGYKMAPVYVTMWIVTIQRHLADSMQSLETILQNSFFENGNLSQGFDGTINDMVKKPNNAMVRVLKRRVFKLGASEIWSATANTGAAANSDAANQRWTNNDFALTKMFNMDITKITPKRYRFNDSVDIQLNNRRRWLFFTCARVDGTQPLSDGLSATGPIVAYAHLNLNYRYKDM